MALDLLEETLPFLVCSGAEQLHWDVPLSVANRSPLWRQPELDQLPLVVECSAAVFADLLRVAEAQSWEQCAQPDQVQLLAQRYQVQLPEPQPDALLPDAPQPSLGEEAGSHADQLLEGLFLADDALLHIYADEPLLRAGVAALLCANQAQALLAQAAPEAIGESLACLLSAQPQPLHALLARRLALLAEQLYQQRCAADGALGAQLRAQQCAFFRTLGQYE